MREWGPKMGGEHYVSTEHNSLLQSTLNFEVEKNKGCACRTEIPIQFIWFIHRCWESSEGHCCRSILCYATNSQNVFRLGYCWQDIEYSLKCYTTSDYGKVIQLFTIVMYSMITYTSVQIYAVLLMLWWFLLAHNMMKSSKVKKKKLVVCVFGLFVSDRASITFHGNQKRGPVALCLCPLPHKTWQTDLPPQWVWDTLSHPPSLHSLSTLKGQEITVWKDRR